MVERFRQIQTIALLATGLLLLAACGTIEVGLEQESLATLPPATILPSLAPPPTATIENPPSPTSTPAVTEQVVTAESPPAGPVSSPLWATYRDPESGFGYAFPCHWLNRDTILKSYDDAFFLKRAVRGHWIDGDPPAGAVKLEIAAFDYADLGIEPGTPLEEAVPLAISDTIVATERVSLGSKDALRVQLEDTVFPGDSTNEIYFFQSSPDSMLLLSVSPRNAINLPDVQGIIDSLALSTGDTIVIPSADPERPLEDREIYFDEAAGYCFQYPSEYTMEAYPPSGIPYLGDIVTLKLERPFYTLGLTATALKVGELSSLDELVTQFINGLPDDVGSGVERNPLDRVGGVDFQVGRQPAEFLEGVPGSGGSRDIFMKQEDRLYRLSFVPSAAAILRLNTRSRSAILGSDHVVLLLAAGEVAFPEAICSAWAIRQTTIHMPSTSLDPLFQLDAGRYTR